MTDELKVEDGSLAEHVKDQFISPVFKEVVPDIIAEIQKAGFSIVTKARFGYLESREWQLLNMLRPDQMPCESGCPWCGGKGYIVSPKTKLHHRCPLDDDGLPWRNGTGKRGGHDDG